MLSHLISHNYSNRITSYRITSYNTTPHEIVSHYTIASHHIFLVFISDLDLERTSLVQEYIANPLLLDGRKFSMALFVAMVSANPARVYLLPSDVGMRFCEKAYYPVDYTDPSTYVTDGSELFNIRTVNRVSINVFVNHFLHP